MCALSFVPYSVSDFWNNDQNHEMSHVDMCQTIHSLTEMFILFVWFSGSVRAWLSWYGLPCSSGLLGAGGELVTEGLQDIIRSFGAQSLLTHEESITSDARAKKGLDGCPSRSLRSAMEAPPRSRLGDPRRAYLTFCGISDQSL